MLRPRDELIDNISKSISSIVGNVKLQTQCTEIMVDKFNLPVKLIQPILTLREYPDMLNDFQLYCFAYTFDKINSRSKLVETYFSDMEIKGYNKSKQKSYKIKFPIDFKMIQIAEDQWTGRLTLDEFKSLFESQIVYYNAATQRKLLHIVNGNTEYLKIDVNNDSVDQIQELMEKDEYVPDQITLNMDEMALYAYDEDSATLRIKSLDHFDILDGYHRYKALVRALNKSEQFNYTMELRITQFSEDKCQQFIYQQDQHTKLKKIDSESLNQNKQSNLIVKRLNNDSLCLLNKQITRNAGIIDASILGKAIESIWFRINVVKGNEQVYAINTMNVIRNNLNEFIQRNSWYINNKWEDEHILAFIYTCFVSENEHIKDFDSTFNYMVKGIRDKFSELNRLGDTQNSTIIRNLNSIYKEAK